MAASPWRARVWRGSLTPGDNAQPRRAAIGDCTVVLHHRRMNPGYCAGASRHQRCSHQPREYDKVCKPTQEEEAMPDIERLTVTLPSDMAAVIKGAVADGDYASTSEVVREALRD